MLYLRFGILGLSPGNGHPYSWSAIFNGYDPVEMARCPFPVIPAYLARQTFPDDAIPNARVTHVWADDPSVASHIAASARIPHVVPHFRDMIGEVDGILLARDDAERHYEFAAPFLAAGLPVYIDKPLALTVADADRLYAAQTRPGLIFTCSALAYAAEFRPTPERLASLGELRFLEGVTVKDWDRYAVHVLDPIQTLVANHGRVVRMTPGGERVRHLDLVWESGLEGRITALGTAAGGISIRLYGEQRLELVFQDAFAAFKAALMHFTDIVAGRVPPQEQDRALGIVRLIEAGRKAA